MKLIIKLVIIVTQFISDKLSINKQTFQVIF